MIKILTIKMAVTIFALWKLAGTVLKQITQSARRFVGMDFKLGVKLVTILKTIFKDANRDVSLVQLMDGFAQEDLLPLNPHAFQNVRMVW